MHIFISYSSADRAIVDAVYEGLDNDSVWIDRAEIEWGDLFLETISRALSQATDFLLFWSVNSKDSGWVRLELNMAFIRMMEENAIRLRVVRLDDTEVPLHLKTYHLLDVSQSARPVDEIVRAVTNLPSSPKRLQRHRFLNRNDELERIEHAIDHGQSHLLLLAGFAGIGKESLAREALRRFFPSAQFVHVNVTEGTGMTEFALYLNARARGTTLKEGLTPDELRLEIRLSLEHIIQSGRFLILTNIQHWLNEDRIPMEPLATIMDCVASTPGYKRTPCLMTSTRRIAPSRSRDPGVDTIWLDGLEEDVISVLVRLWYELSTGRELTAAQASSVAAQTYGHPVAAKLAASLAAQYGTEYLQKYPREYVSLRRDLAKAMLLDMQLLESTFVLLKSLAAADAPLPPSVLNAALGVEDEEFHKSISQATSAGLIFQRTTALSIHPLVAEHFGQQLGREDSSILLNTLASEMHKFAETFEVGSPEFSQLLPTVFRLYAAAGQWETAREIRSDLYGEIERAAIFHYRRRSYDLAWEYVQHALDAGNPSWNIRLHQARILIRKERWPEADEVLEQLLSQRSTDRSALQVRGWSLRRRGRFEEALSVFAGVVAQSEHVISLQGAADCLHELGRDKEALAFLARAKSVESDNPFVLDLEAKILEESGEFEAAYKAAYLAMIRDPNNWAFHHRLGRIRIGQNRQFEAIEHLRNAADCDEGQFTPLHSLAATLLDLGEVEEANRLAGELQEKATTANNRDLLVNLQARILIEQGEIEKGSLTLEREIRRKRNLLPNLGAYADAKIREYDHSKIEFPTKAGIALSRARQAVSDGLSREQANQYLLELRQRIEERNGQ